MADVATPSAAKVATPDASAPEGKQQIVKPEKPDEAAFKEGLAKLEKAHTAAQEKFVSSSGNFLDACNLEGSFEEDIPLSRIYVALYRLQIQLRILLDRPCGSDHRLFVWRGKWQITDL